MNIFNSKLISVFLFVTLALFALHGLTNFDGASASRPHLNTPVPANTIAFKFNGKPVTQAVQANFTQDGDHTYFSLRMGGDLQDRLAFVLNENNLRTGVYELNDPNNQYAHVHVGETCVYTTNAYYSGVLILHTIDREKRTVEGSFELLAYAEDCEQGIRLTEGRFKTGYLIH
jgi:hypothetical protein